MKTLLTIIAALAITGAAFAQSGAGLPAFGGKLYETATTPSNGTSEIQTLTIGGTPTGGTFKISYAGKTTAAITWSATNSTLVANIDAALEALATLSGGSSVTTAVGTATAGIGTFTVTFTGNYAKLDVALMTINTNALTGTSPTLAIATTTAGVTADGRGSAKKGSLCVALDTGILYGNTGTALVPVWGKVSGQ